MKFLIFAPPYRNSSAGVRVLHRLAAELNKLGCSAFVFTAWKKFDQLKANIGDCIVVYPEIIEGNPIGAKNVVRYILNKPGYMEEKGATYAESELVFVYTEALLETAQSFTSQKLDDSRLMEISVIEPWIFQPKPEIEKVYDVAFWIGKGIETAQGNGEKIQDYLQGKRHIQITYDQPGTREGLASLFQSCREFLTADDFTAMIPEAMLCGCKVTIVTPTGLVACDGDPGRWRTAWHDTSAIGNFVSVCRQKFLPCAAAA